MQETGSAETADTTIRSPANPCLHHTPEKIPGLRGFAGVRSKKRAGRFRSSGPQDEQPLEIRR